MYKNLHEKQRWNYHVQYLTTWSLAIGLKRFILKYVHVSLEMSFYLIKRTKQSNVWMKGQVKMLSLNKCCVNAQTISEGGIMNRYCGTTKPAAQVTLAVISKVGSKTKNIIARVKRKPVIIAF